LWVHIERERERERVDSGVTSDYPQSSTVLSRLCPSLTFLAGEAIQLGSLWAPVGRGAFIGCGLLDLHSAASVDMVIEPQKMISVVQYLVSASAFIASCSQIQTSHDSWKLAREALLSHLAINNVHGENRKD
jgi:hypothetical protein